MYRSIDRSPEIRYLEESIILANKNAFVSRGTINLISRTHVYPLYLNFYDL